MATQLAISGMEEIAKRDDVNPLVILQSAVNSGASVETLERLMALAERYQANMAKAQFDAAMAAFKSNPPKLVKNKLVHFENKAGQVTEYKHETLDAVTEQITSALSAVGIQHRYEPTNGENGSVGVTCILSGFGHEVKTGPIFAPSDNSGGKNGIQAVGSALTYLQRYTLKMACGLAAAEDDDGKTTGMSDLQEQLEWIANACNLDELKKLWTNAKKAAIEAKDHAALEAINKAKEARKAVLNGQND